MSKIIAKTVHRLFRQKRQQLQMTTQEFQDHVALAMQYALLKHQIKPDQKPWHFPFLDETRFFSGN